MYKDILHLLRCPACMGELKLSITEEKDDEILNGSLTCNDGHTWLIHDGVIDFNSREQEFANNWSEFEEQMGFDEMDNMIREKTPENIKKLNTEAIQKVVNTINVQSPEFVLDIATGRGTLLCELAKNAGSSTAIIALDLSYAILRSDRMKIKKINSAAKISYIACDASNLPFKDNSIDMAASFYGLSNMLDLMPKGVQEAGRTLKPGKSLLSVDIAVKEDSKGYEALKKFAKDNNITLPDKYAAMEGLELRYINRTFKFLKVDTVGEGIGIKNELDLLPFEDEWFAVIIVECRK